MVDGDRTFSLCLMYSSIALLSGKEFSGVLLAFIHPDLTATASAIACFLSGFVMDILWPSILSWINYDPDGSFLGSGIFIFSLPFRGRYATIKG